MKEKGKKKTKKQIKAKRQKRQKRTREGGGADTTVKVWELNNFAVHLS